MNLQQFTQINDAATGRDARAASRTPTVATFAPHGRLTEFATGVNQDVGGNVQLGKKWSYIDGTCEILLLL